MGIQSEIITATVDASGDATVYSQYRYGDLDTIEYIPDGTNPYANTVDLTITNERSTEAVLSQSNVSAAFRLRPTAAVHDTTGSARLYAAGGTGVSAPFSFGGDRLKIVIAQGGVSKTGTFRINWRV